MALVALIGVMVCAASGPARMAVMDMQDLSGAEKALGAQLTQVVVSEVASSTDLKVISSNEIGQVLGFERQKQLLGCTESGCMAELAGALGADYLLTATVSKLGSRYRIDMRIVDAKKSTIIATAGDFVDGTVDAAADGTVRLTQKLLDGAGLTRGRTSVAKVSPAPAAATAQVEQPVAPVVSHTRAYAFWVASAALAIGAAAMTAATISTFNQVSNPQKPLVQSDASSLKWKGPLADGLWGAAAVAAAGGAYFYMSAGPAAGSEGSGGEVMVGGRF